MNHLLRVTSPATRTNSNDSQIDKRLRRCLARCAWWREGFDPYFCLNDHSMQQRRTSPSRRRRPPSLQNLAISIEISGLRSPPTNEILLTLSAPVVIIIVTFSRTCLIGKFGLHLKHEPEQSRFSRRRRLGTNSATSLGALVE